MRDTVQAVLIVLAGLLASAAIVLGAYSLSNAHDAITQNCQNIERLQGNLVGIIDRGEGRALQQSKSVGETKSILAASADARRRVQVKPCAT